MFLLTYSLTPGLRHQERHGDCDQNQFVLGVFLSIFYSIWNRPTYEPIHVQFININLPIHTRPIYKHKSIIPSQTTNTGSDTNTETKDVIVSNSVPLKDFLVIKTRHTCVQSNTREPSEDECKQYASQTDGVTFEAAPIGLAETSGCIILQDKVYFQPNEEPNQKCFSGATCVCVSGGCC